MGLHVMIEASDFIVHFAGRYRFMCTENDTDLFKPITSRLDYGIQSIEHTFNIHADIPFINIFCCPSREVFDSFVQLFTNVPTNEQRIGQSQGHDIYLLSPKSYRRDAACYARRHLPFYDVEDFYRTIVHELVHVWEELCSPTGAMEVRPAWFAEGMAMYVSGSYREREFRQRLADDYKNGIIPGPDEIRGTRNYTWGCILFEFMLKEFGPHNIMDVIQNSCEHNICSLLEPDVSLFRKAYSRFVQSRLECIDPDS
jgi:hypothetical protein